MSPRPHGQSPPGESPHPMAQREHPYMYSPCSPTTRNIATQAALSPSSRASSARYSDARTQTRRLPLEFDASKAHIQLANFWTDPNDFPIHLQPIVRREVLTREDANARWEYALKHMGTHHHPDAIFHPPTVFLTLRAPIMALLPSARKHIILNWAKHHDEESLYGQAKLYLNTDTTVLKPPPEWVVFPPLHDWKDPIRTCMGILYDMMRL
ncbi:uncharacterized protein F5Z01DRAFT_51269 [Emericellopsis atlantica]|uniref:Uncharacterized protein n=1 Tax=Emericellopsis atlantica TaxID=2614577 RepID=A0A9P7ZPB9_9HYPO|nr:uncharacterized protein F5Z01DRAFT_51269 [Emericellopsis atlantica]KAG9255382.1 hypothetical protein F5Z01DRAFT_51269 [Emericellopsis atlantica]